ncbi:hypothetical protein QJS66_14565 [Kocuria rhizophila]|nr:hypothetical protein QJS66_14565 [Kocuria rhizophila]
MENCPWSRQQGPWESSSSCSWGSGSDRFRLTVILRCVEVADLVVAAGVALAWRLVALALWHAAFVFSGAVGFFYPAYSAALPRILPVHQLLAANGGWRARPALLQLAAGPAVGGALTGLALPGPLCLAIAVCHAVALVFMLRLRLPERGGDGAQDAGGVRSPRCCARCWRASSTACAHRGY